MNSEISNGACKLIVKAMSENEAFVRVVAAAFFARINPTIDELQDIKTAISEAVTNAVIHAYPDNPNGEITAVFDILDDNIAYIEINDSGVGIQDVEGVRDVLYTSRPDLERSGMGFSIMEGFMDDVRIISTAGRGTSLIMTKKIAN